VPGVYAWAEWTQYGAHGRGGPLMVQDATSSASGLVTFPRWGPSFGSTGGILLGFDPSVILFKPGYATLLVQNTVPGGGRAARAPADAGRRATSSDNGRFMSPMRLTEI
jgi:hypothetical protein